MIVQKSAKSRHQSKVQTLMKGCAAIRYTGIIIAFFSLCYTLFLELHENNNINPAPTFF